MQCVINPTPRPRSIFGQCCAWAHVARGQSIRWQRECSLFFGCLGASGKSRSPGPVSPGSVCVHGGQRHPRLRLSLFRMDLGGGHRDWKPACLRLALPGPRWPSTLAKQKEERVYLVPNQSLESHRHPFGVVPEGKCQKNKGSSRQSSWMMCFSVCLSKTGRKQKARKGACSTTHPAQTRLVPLRWAYVNRGFSACGERWEPDPGPSDTKGLRPMH